MNIKFKDINPGMYPAKISSIKEERGPTGVIYDLTLPLQVEN
jgi:hypothetical protein